MLLLAGLSGAFFRSPGRPDTLKMTPYLQAVGPDSICVLAEDDSDAPITVEYGPTESYGRTAQTGTTTATNVSPATYIHNLHLTGLEAHTLYHYRLFREAPLSDDFVFTTASAPGTPFRFAWMADMRTGVDVHDQIAARIKNESPLFSLYGGDLAADSSYATFKYEFFRPNQLALISGIPFFTAVGNHEGWSANTQAFLEAPASASGTQAYYSFDYGDLHVLVLNTNLDYSPDSAQYAFARSDLESATRRWKVVISHSPAYCAGGHGEDAGMVRMTGDLFEPNRVHLVISGHSHFYQHSLVRGIHHLVIGSAGAPLHTPGTADYVIKSAKDYNYAIGDVTPWSLQIVVYNHTGLILDQIRLGQDVFLPLLVSK